MVQKDRKVHAGGDDAARSEPVRVALIILAAIALVVTVAFVLSRVWPG
ncbi:hypothetical protein ACVWWJ_002432 [Luteibacter sp. HA06]|jgi:hypothetical protein